MPRQMQSYLGTIECRSCSRTPARRDTWLCPECQADAEDMARRLDEGEESGVGAFFGQWPGDETDKELIDALDEVRGNDSATD